MHVYSKDSALLSPHPVILRPARTSLLHNNMKVQSLVNSGYVQMSVIGKRLTSWLGDERKLRHGPLSLSYPEE